MSNVVQLFKATADSGFTGKSSKSSDTKKATLRRPKVVELTAEAGKLAQSIKMLSTINCNGRELREHLTYRNQIELTQNFEKALDLLLQFAEELKFDAEQNDIRNSKSPGTRDTKVTS